MYPSSSSSSSHSSLGPSGGSPLFRYGSAPGSLFTAAVDSVIGQHHRSEELSPLGPPPPPRYFSSETSSESNNKTATGDPNKEILQRSYGLNDGVIGNRNGTSLSSSSPSPLVRHSSSPAGFLNRLASSASPANGFSVTRGIGSYNSKGGSDTVSGIQRLNSQLSFTRQDSLSQITEESEDGDDDIHAENKRKSAHSYATANFGMGSWDNSSTIMFSAPPGKRAKSDISGLNIMEAQFQFDLASVEHMIDIPQDSVTCKARAKRGCATHPRSIAERERRTRISGKLKKLQDLVPNMDKQTSYADMLDLAVQHIKGLQTQVQKLNTELEHCTCGCKKTTQCSQ